MKYIKNYLSVIASLIIMQSFAAAQETECSFSSDILSDRVEFSIFSDANTHFAFQVLKSDVEIENLENAENPALSVSYTGDFKTDSDGKQSVGMILKESDDYVLYLKAVGGSEVKEYPFYFAASKDYEELVGLLNDALKEDKEAIGSVLFDGEENLKILGFNNELINDIDKDKVLEIYFEEAQDGIELEDYTENSERFVAVCAIVSLNEDDSKTPDMILEYIKGVLDDDKTLAEFLEKHIKSEEADEYFTSKLSGQNTEDLEDLAEKSKEAIILTAVKYPDGNTNIKKIFSEYKDILGISSVTSDTDVYRELAGKDFDNISELAEDYEKRISKSNSGSTGSGGGGKGTGTGKTQSSIVAGAGGAVINSGDRDKNEALGIKFTDLDTVDWAYESISRLYEKGIVNGYNEYEFKPEKSVKREEFIKMLVCALNLEDSAFESGVFSDTKDQWCEKYVCIAYKNGFVNGIGSGLFGRGLDITRQDMAVMIYNAMVSYGVASTGNELSFADSAEISDYAKAAVASLSASDIVDGTGDGMFSPKDVTTRAQAAVIIDRAMKYFN